MNQSTFITAMLLAGFVLFLAANNRLGTYAAVLWGATAAPPPQATKSGGGGGNFGSIMGAAKHILTPSNAIKGAEILSAGG